MVFSAPHSNISRSAGNTSEFPCRVGQRESNSTVPPMPPQPQGHPELELGPLLDDEDEDEGELLLESSDDEEDNDDEELELDDELLLELLELDEEDDELELELEELELSQHPSPSASTSHLQLSAYRLATPYVPAGTLLGLPHSQQLPEAVCPEVSWQGQMSGQTTPTES